MKRFRGLVRYGMLGVINTVLGYTLFVALSSVVSQLAASVIAEITVQTIKYHGLGLFVFKEQRRTRPPPATYILHIIPGSVVLFANVAILSKFTPPYVTGLLGIIVSLLYYKIFKALYKPRKLGQG